MSETLDRIGSMDSEFAVLNTNKKFWFLTQKKASGLRLDTKYFKRVARAAARAANQNPLVLAQPHIIHVKLSEVTEKMREYKKVHTDKCNSWLENLAKAMADNETEEGEDTDVKTLSYIKLLRH
jgi:stalled ribosome rescue protein Dom34